MGGPTAKIIAEIKNSAYFTPRWKFSCCNLDPCESYLKNPYIMRCMHRFAHKRHAQTARQIYLPI